MTEAEALARVRGYALAGRFVFSRTGHAGLRMRQRNVRLQDVRSALVRAFHCSAQENGRSKVEGPDVDGDDLTVIVLIEDGLIIVTVYGWRAAS
jgi:hypothetical protein